MLWLFEPVKYCSAAPREAGSTSRRSAWMPLNSSTLALVSPRPSTRTTLGLRGEAVHHVGRRASGQDVEVAAGLGAPAQAADGHELGGGKVSAQLTPPADARRPQRPPKVPPERSGAAPRSP